MLRHVWDVLVVCSRVGSSGVCWDVHVVCSRVGSSGVCWDMLVYVIPCCEKKWSCYFTTSGPFIV